MLAFFPLVIAASVFESIRSPFSFPVCSSLLSVRPSHASSFSLPPLSPLSPLSLHWLLCYTELYTPVPGSTGTSQSQLAVKLFDRRQLFKPLFTVTGSLFLGFCTLMTLERSWPARRWNNELGAGSERSVTLALSVSRWYLIRTPLDKGTKKLLSVYFEPTCHQPCSS